jgi:RNA polymerase sigma factor (sigma-70 family)
MSPPSTAPEPAALTAPPCASPSLDSAQWFKQEVHAHDGQLKSWLKGTYPSARGEVDDIVQESYLRIWKRQAAKPIASAKAFLFQIARRLALDTIRKNGNSPLDQVGDLAASRVIDGRPNAAEILISRDMLAHLADAIAALPERPREVLLLHKIKGLPQKEVAAQLGLSERTVEKYCLKGMVGCEAFLRDRGILGFFR